MQMNFKLAHTAVAAGALVMVVGRLVIGSDPSQLEAAVIVFGAYLAAGLTLGLLAGRGRFSDKRR